MKKFLFVLAALIVVSSSPGIFTTSGNSMEKTAIQKPRTPPKPKTPKKIAKKKAPKKAKSPKPAKKPKTPPKPPWVK
jgi:hypothetical protein